jgi:ubiquinone/menaquinone biosynthesis C-methylase UbiE
MNCDLIAPWYRWLEYGAFGKELERRRFAFLPNLRVPRRVLMAGEGDGRFLRAFLERYPAAEVDYLDASAKMLRLARRRTPRWRVNYQCEDLRSVPLPRAAYDLIVTHFFLDCFSQTEADLVAARLAASATPDAQWLISEFRQPDVWGRPVLFGLYAFFRITTGLTTTRLPDHAPPLRKNGFRLQGEAVSKAGLLASELWRREPGLAPATLHRPVSPTLH